MRVDDDEAGRPEQLFGVEPERLRRDQRPLDDGVAEVQRLPGAVERRVGDGDGDSHREERSHPQQVGAGHPAALPPMADQERGRQGDDDGLAEQPENEQGEGQEVMFPPAPFREAEPGRGRGEVEQGRKHVLSLHDPGDGFDVQGVDGEHRRDGPGAGNLQPTGEAPEEQRIGGVEQDVDRVIAGRRESPEFVLDPEGRVDQRPVMPLVRDGAGGEREPYLPQPGPVPDRRGFREHLVVPDEPGGEGGKVDGGRQQTEPQGGEGLPVRGSRDRGAGRSGGRGRRGFAAAASRLSPCRGARRVSAHRRPCRRIARTSSRLTRMSRRAGSRDTPRSRASSASACRPR